MINIYILNFENPTYFWSQISYQTSRKGCKKRLCRLEQLFHILFGFKKKYPSCWYLTQRFKGIQLKSISHICALAYQARGQKGGLITFISHLKRESLKQGNKYSNDFAPLSYHIKLMICSLELYKKKAYCLPSPRGVAVNTVGGYSPLSVCARSYT